MCRREYGQIFLAPQHFPGDGVDYADLFHLIAEKSDPRNDLLVDRLDLQHIAANSKSAAAKGDVIARELHIYQPAKNILALIHIANAYIQHRFRVALFRTDAEDAAHAGYHQHIAAFDDGLGGGVAQAVDFVVDRGVFFDVGIGLRDVGLRQIIIVIADEVFDRVVREKFSKFRTELCGKGLVMGEH